MNRRLPIKFLITILVFLSSFSSLLAQSNLFKQTFTDAEYYILMQDYREALPLYQKLYRMDSTNANVNYRLGQCYLNIPGLKSKAIPYLENATKSINPKYNEGSYKETQAPPVSLFNLGEAYMVNHMLDKALEVFSQFKERLDVKDIYNLDYVNQQIKACENAKEFLKTPIRIETEKVIPFAERNKNCNYPTLSGDRQSMIFTVKEKFYSGIFYCTKEQDKWSTPKNITLELAIEGEVYSTALNQNGTQLLLFKNDITTGTIYYSNLINGKWQPVKKLNNGISSKDWETFVSYANNDKTLLFTSNRKGGLGGIDIYMADLTSNGSWGNIRNLSDINTPYNEESPILSSDGETLYFASQGHNSMGGFDIFYSRLLPNGKWSTPINMGYPINTPDDEFYYFPLDSTSGLMPLVSKDLITFYEIYKVDIKPAIVQKYITLLGKTILSDNAEINSDSILVTIKNISDSSIFAQVKPTGSLGDFTTKIIPGNYVLEATCRNYTMEPVNLFIPENHSQNSFNVELTLIPKIVSQGLALKLKNILFDFDSYTLSRDSKFELEKVYSLMEASPQLYIEVIGHTDSKGSPTYNLKLSSKRAKSVVEYLVAKGIDERRFIVKGLGALSSIASNINPDGSDNPAGRCLNRRASIKIISGNKSIQIDNVDVPENLKPQNLTYTILIARTGDSIDNQSIKNVERELDMYSTRTDIGTAFYLNIGSFENKSKAISTLNKVVEFFPNASLVSEVELRRLIKYEFSIRENAKTVYTILLMTSETPVEKSAFKGVVPTEQKGTDGIYRYYFGTYSSKEVAQSNLEKINPLGYPNAMIVKFK